MLEISKIVWINCLRYFQHNVKQQNQFWFILVFRITIKHPENSWFLINKALKTAQNCTKNYTANCYYNIHNIYKNHWNLFYLYELSKHNRFLFWMEISQQQLHILICSGPSPNYISNKYNHTMLYADFVLTTLHPRLETQ